MRFFTKSISQGQEALQGCQDNRAASTILFNKEKGNILALYGPYEEALISYLADPKHPSDTTGTTLIERATDYTKLTLHLQENYLTSHVDMLRDFAITAHAKQISLFCPKLTLPEYQYQVRIDYDQQLIVIPANIFQQELYRKQGKIINPYIRTSASQRKIIELPFRDWPHVRNFLKRNVAHNNSFADLVLAQTDQAFRKKDPVVDLPVLLDRFSNQVSMLELLINSSIGLQHLLHSAIPIVIQAQSAAEKELLEAHLTDTAKQREIDIPITITSGSSIRPTPYVIDVSLNNLIATYMLGQMRSVAMLSEALSIHKQTNQPIQVSFYNPETCTENILYALADTKETLTPKETINLYTNIPQSWRSSFSVQTSAELRHAISNIFHDLYREFFHQFAQHIVFANDNQTAEIFFSNRYFRNEADYYKRIRGKIILEPHARLVLDCDFSIAIPRAVEGGQLIIKENASGLFVPEFPGASNTFIIEGNTQAIIPKGNSCRIVFGRNSQLLFDHDQPSVPDFETDMESGTNFTFSRETGEHTTILLHSHYLFPNKKYHDIPSPQPFAESLKTLARLNRSLIVIDDNEIMRENLIPAYLEISSKNQQLMHTYASIESFLETTDEKNIGDPGIIIVDENLGLGKMSGIKSLPVLHTKYPRAELILFAKQENIDTSSNTETMSFANIQEDLPNTQFIDKPNNDDIFPGAFLQKAVIEAIEKIQFGTA